MFIVTSVAAVVPVLILMLGTGFWFRVAMVFMAAVWYIMLTVYQGARGIERRWIDVGRSFGAAARARRSARSSCLHCCLTCWWLCASA